MRVRWGLAATRVCAASVALFAGNALARLITRLAYPGQAEEMVPGLWVHGATAVVAAVIAALWVRWFLVSKVSGWMFWAGLISTVLIVVTGPLISGGEVFPGWSALYLLRIVVVFATIAVGAALGVLFTVATGADALSKAWQRRAENPAIKSRGRKSKASSTVVRTRKRAKNSR